MSLSDIPVTIFLEILLPQLAVADILAIAATSRFFYRVANDEVLWQILTLRDYKLIFPQAASDRVGWRTLYSKLWDPIVYTWGASENSRLGHPAVRYSTTHDEEYQDEPSPRELTSLRGRGVVDIVPGGFSFHVLDRNGLVWMWGNITETGTVYNLPTRVHLPTSVSSISCGRTHAMALSQGGRAFQWCRVEAPVEIIISSNSPIMHIAAGWGFGALLTASGEIFCFTEDALEGAKAQTHVSEHVTLASVLASSTSLFAEAEVLGTMFTSVACGESFMVALTDAGAVLRFRMMLEDLLVDTSSVEHLTKFTFDAGMQDTDKTITRITAFFRHFAAVNHEGAVLLGEHDSSSPTVFSELRKGICQVSFGDWHYGAITADGRLLTWGSVSSGALGHPMETAQPTVVGGALVGKYVFAIGFGGWQSGALAVDLSDEAGAKKRELEIGGERREIELAI